MSDNDLFKEAYLNTVFEYSVDYKDRRIWVGDIAPDEAQYFVQSLAILCNYSLEPIKIYISSYGGNDDAMLYMYDSIINCPADIHTVGSGVVASAAVLILIAGDRRYLTENAFVMTHKGTANLSGDDDSIVAAAEAQKALAERYWKIMARHTTKTARFWYQTSRNKGEFWLDAKHAKDLGVVDEIITWNRKRNFKPLSNRPIKGLEVTDMDDELDLDEDTE